MLNIFDNPINDDENFHISILFYLPQICYLNGKLRDDILREEKIENQLNQNFKSNNNINNNILIYFIIILILLL